MRSSLRVSFAIGLVSLVSACSFRHHTWSSGSGSSTSYSTTDYSPSYTPSATTESAAFEEVEYFNTYSRPNDDTFQNAAGNAGQPYEVARVRVAINAKGTTDAVKVALKWAATLVTGRHVEAGSYFQLASSTHNLSGYGYATESQVRVVYPPGKGAESTSEEKKGSVLTASLELGEMRVPGYYSGDAVVKLAAPAAEGDSTKHFSDKGPKGGVFKRIHWELYFDGASVSNIKLEYKRAKDPQVRLIQTNIFTTANLSLITSPYPPQPAAAVCYEEKVGDGAQDTESHSRQSLFEKAMGKKIRAAGCLSCHGEGVGDNQLFCDNGVAVHPSTTYPSMVNFLANDVDWSRYRQSMRDCFIDLNRKLSSHEIEALRRYGKN